MAKLNKSFLVIILITTVIWSNGILAKPSGTKISILLDWVPNTNHTGLYVAKELGYYRHEGIEAHILQPSESDSAALVAANKADFGISYQEQVTYARTANFSLPVKAIAAIIQHNTSGFAAPLGKGIKSPADFVGKTYGGWGSPMEEAVLKGLMQKYRVDFAKLRMVNIGAADFFASVGKDVDFSWIYYGWDGVAAQLRNFPITFIKLRDVDPRLDYYTPVIIANENLIRKNPALIKKFMKATSSGYVFAIHNPEKAAQILTKYAPEIDKKLAVASQKYLAGEYQAEAPRWGEMRLAVWQNYSNWMFENGLLKKRLDAKEAFSNEFLPAK